MIPLTKLDDTSILVNTDSIKYVEKSPNSLVFFLNGESLLVQEPLSEIQELFEKEKAHVLRLSRME